MPIRGSRADRSGGRCGMVSVLGIEHPNTVTSMNIMLAIWEQQGMEECARTESLNDLLKRALHRVQSTASRV